MSDNPKDRLWKEFHYWQWKSPRGKLLRIVRNETTGKWTLKRRFKGKWKIVEKNFRTRADAMMAGEDKFR